MVIVPNQNISPRVRSICFVGDKVLCYRYCATASGCSLPTNSLVGKCMGIVLRRNFRQDRYALGPRQPRVHERYIFHARHISSVPPSFSEIDEWPCIDSECGGAVTPTHGQPALPLLRQSSIVLSGGHNCNPGERTSSDSSQRPRTGPVSKFVEQLETAIWIKRGVSKPLWRRAFPLFTKTCGNSRSHSGVGLAGIVWCGSEFPWISLRHLTARMLVNAIRSRYSQVMGALRRIISMEAVRPGGS